VLPADSCNLGLQTTRASIRQRHGAVLVALSLADHKLPPPEIDVLHSQPTTLQQTQPGSISQFDHQSVRPTATLDVGNQACNFIL
jgi:hypothetical protein